MARPDVNIVSQYGFQSALGTGVTAATLTTSDSVTFDAEWQEQWYRQPGNKFTTVGVTHRRWTRGVREGLLDYNHYPAILASMFGHGTIVNSAGSSSYPISVNSRTANSPKYISYQSGDATAARGADDCMHTGLSVTFGENEINYSSPFIGRAMNNADTLDTVSRTLTQQPVSIADLDWYLDSTYGGIGMTKITDVVSGGFEIPDIAVPKFVQNTTYPSWSELVEQAVEGATVRFVTEYNAQARALYDAFNVDVKPTRYLQIRAQGELISGAIYHLIKHNFAVKPEKPVERRAPSGGIYGYEFPFRVVDDATMGRGMEATIINTTSLP